MKAGKRRALTCACLSMLLFAPGALAQEPDTASAAAEKESAGRAYPIPLVKINHGECIDTKMKKGKKSKKGECKDEQQARQDAGVPLPQPRFRNNQDGTVTDRLTGLVWLANLNCFDKLGWEQAQALSESLASGHRCLGPPHLDDGSKPGEWRIPNRNELNSLLDLRYSEPALSNTQGDARWSKDGDSFYHYQRDSYWTSTLVAGEGDKAWGIKLEDGNMGRRGTKGVERLLPVRGP